MEDLVVLQSRFQTKTGPDGVLSLARPPLPLVRRSVMTLSATEGRRTKEQEDKENNGHSHRVGGKLVRGEN